MTYDEGLAHRVRETLGGGAGLTERELFGGLAFMLDGNMACGVVDDALLARIGPDAYEDALAEPHVREMDFTGRPMRGLVFVDPAGVAEDEDLVAWLDRCVAFAGSLPAK
jgi:hypothetical protein